MIDSQKISDFSAGWTPGIDPINGPKNGLLKMDSVELDQTGALVMSGGCKNIFSFDYASDAHTIYSKYISGIQKRYVSLVNSKVYRDTTLLSAFGSATRTAFGSAFDYVFIMSGDLRIKDSGSSTSDIGIATPAALSATAAFGGNLTGDYEYAQINVHNYGNGYLAKSALSPVAPVTVAAQNVRIIPVSLGTGNEAWIYRRGGNLDQFYRIAVVTSTATFFDDLTDEDALDLNETASNFLLPTNIEGIPEAVLEMCGLIRGRMIYFSSFAVYPSAVNSPDSYDTRHVINFGANQSTGSELFLWAHQIGENSILVGTTADVYLLTGSFVEFADGILDIYLRPLGIENPPISRDCGHWENKVIYMSADGWRVCAPNGETANIVGPLDRLYRGNTLNGYGGVPIYIYPATDSGGNQLRYSCAVARNKLWCRVPVIVNNDVTQVFTYRVEVYDLNRKYWRTIDINPLMLYSQEDDAVMGFFNASGVRNLREIDNQFDKTLNTVKQTIKVTTPFYDSGSRRRHDVATIKLLIDTGGDDATLVLNSQDGATSTTISSSLNSSGYSEKIFTINQTIKNWQLAFTGQLVDFKLGFIVVSYEARPEQISFYNYKKHDFGEYNPLKKRVRVWPITIDTLGQNFTFTPYVDGNVQTAQTINTSRPQTVLYQFKTDVFGTDYGFIINNNAVNIPFELYDIGQPEIVHILPIAKQYDQLGPVELFRYGKIKTIRCRIFPTFTGALPWEAFFQDTSIGTGNMDVTANKEDSFELVLPKTSAGQIFRLVLGPTPYDFHRYNAEALVIKGGRDSDNEWVPLEV